MNYMVEIDERGLLRWARNHEPVDTSPGKWKDSGNGNGIIATAPTDTTEKKPAVNHRTSFLASPPISQRPSYRARGVDSTINATKDDTPSSKLRIFRRGLKRVSFTNRIRTRLLRSLLSKDTWIYVAVCAIYYFFANPTKW